MMNIGIVGLPNVGKSTLFKALTRKTVDIANYPFCTIEPNVGVVSVPDDRLTQLSTVSHSAQTIPAAIEFVDIAGLVAGAHKGEGLGNQFLAAIREVDAIAHVVRVFSDPNVIHVNGAPDPLRDQEIIMTELAMADLVTVEKRRSGIAAKMKSGTTKDLLTQQATLEKLYTTLNTGKAARFAGLSEEETSSIADLHLLTAKPMMLITNIDEGTSQPPIDTDLPVIALCAKLEAELADLPAEEAARMLTDLGLPESGLTRLIRTSYETLNLITYFTSGEKESRAWTITRGTKAPQAAGVIHTDFEKGFIRAEITHWNDFIKYGELGCRERGLTRIEGKDYVMQDGDTCYFRVAT